MSELFLKYSPLSTGITQLDDEHSQLHIEAKRVSALIARHEDLDEIHDSVLAFAELLEAHFRFEQTMFDRLLKHRAIEHRDEHAKLLLSLRIFADVARDREREQNWEDFINLEDILLKHIIMFDMDFKE